MLSQRKNDALCIIVAHVVITLSAETECDGFGTGVAICIIGEQSRSADVGFVAQEVIVHVVVQTGT